MEISLNFERRCQVFFAKRFISLGAAEQLSIDLAKRAKMFNPDCVVSIEKGGWFVGDRIAKYLDLPHLQVVVARFSDEELDKLYASIPQPIRFLGLAIHQLRWHLRESQLWQGVERPEQVAGKRILLVDDAVRTGGTMRIAREYLLSLRPASIDMMALSCVRGFQPMYLSMLQGHHCYPWSRISPEYERFRTIHRLAHAP